MSLLVSRGMLAIPIPIPGSPELPVFCASHRYTSMHGAATLVVRVATRWRLPDLFETAEPICR